MFHRYKDETWICSLNGVHIIQYCWQPVRWLTSYYEFGKKFGGTSWQTWQEEQGSHWRSALKLFLKTKGLFTWRRGTQVGEVTRFGGVIRLSIYWSLILIWSRLLDGWGNPPHVTSPIWDPSPPGKQALANVTLLAGYTADGLSEKSQQVQTRSRKMNLMAWPKKRSCKNPSAWLWSFQSTPNNIAWKTASQHCLEFNLALISFSHIKI